MNGKEKLNEYILRVCGQISNKDVHESITLELESHFADKIEDFQSMGYSEEDAIQKAIAVMGDPVTIGKQLHQAHKPRMEWSVMVMVSILIGMGLLTMYSLSLSEQSGRFAKQLISMSCGVVAFASMLFFNYTKIKRYSTLLYSFTFLLMIFTIVSGTTINGTPFLEIGSLQLDWIRISPYLLAIAMAGIFSDWNWERRSTFFKALGFFPLPFALYANAHDMFAFILFTIAFLVLVMSLMKKRGHILGFLGMFTVFISGFFYLLAPHQKMRLSIFLNPYADPDGAGYLTLQLMKTVHSAGLWGNGLGARLDRVPDVQYDFVFAYVVHSFGLVTGAAVMVIGLLLLLRLIRAMKLVKDRYGSLLMACLMSLFFTPYFWSILMTVGFVPISSVDLPFFSNGSVQLILQMALIGLLLSIYRRKDILPLSQNRG
ncbi:FtsW/RodA/SpoVE family cell cycle protein [Brevibacillus brevis]|uniref:FtsW/RodA/SpoVE family cell cycle protein n=1 Tax=Brevibacillus brevis TaxID=1393 RepID=A0ABY9T4X2_BREBE|nr:FtsW/RodA/SpoVE family cell cycle protein [Brevibacillus brevis]WNC15145.1 FtsW/RodA/SpoVE family cell cycle protein [Brevibacillus brevis]